MRKFLLTLFFVAFMATPLAAQPTATPASVMKPVAMAPAVAAPRPVAMRPVPRPAMVMKPTPVAMAPVTVAVAPPVAAMAAPATMAAPTPAPVEPAMAATPDTAPKVAPATKKDSKGSVIGGWLLQLLLGILGIVITTISYPLVRWLLKKMKIEDQKATMMVDDMVDRSIWVGIHYAEEQAHKLKDNPIDGAKKLDMAGSKAQAYLQDSGVVGKGAEYLKDLIESKLGESRLAGVYGLKLAVGVVEEKATDDKKEDDDATKEKKDADE